jgi:hypothetical protein
MDALKIDFEKLVAISPRLAENFILNPDSTIDVFQMFLENTGLLINPVIRISGSTRILAWSRDFLVPYTLISWSPDIRFNEVE